jgi:putative ABC transport system permease protein
MAPRALFRLGFRSLLVHKLRSTLSLLGVVFGVAAVVAMASVGEGARREAVEQIGALGIDSITIRARRGEGAASSSRLRIRDAEAVAHVVPHVLAVAPVREAALPAELAGRRLDVSLVGTTPAYAYAARLPVRAGRFLTDLDLKDRKRVAILGAAVARQLAPLGDPRGAQVRVGGDWYTVVGVLEGRALPRAKALPIRTRDVNRAVFVPLLSLDRGGSGGPDEVDEIVVRVDRGESVGASAEVVRALLKRTTGAADAEIVVPREILRQRQRTQRIFDVVTGAVAAIGLLVGGIGIMNIMLASVAERTQEVGVRRAVGATRRDIAAQFLTESSLLTMAGGLAGLLLGVLGSSFIQRWAEWPTALSLSMLLMSLLTALGVGIGFGLYPAWQAAQLQPMDALRRT